MTFIASVIAKDGIAIIADSLVSTMERSLNQKTWSDFLKKKVDGAGGKDFKLSEEEITNLFELKPSHTKDYENKLLPYDDFTAITTAGGAVINGKKIEKLVADIKKIHQKKKADYEKKKIEKKVEEFSGFLEEQVKAHLGKLDYVNSTIFIVSHHQKSTGKSFIFKLVVNSASSSALKDPAHEYITTTTHNQPVVCDGQDGAANRILYGGVLDDLVTHGTIHELTKKELEDNGIAEGKGLPVGFFTQLKEKQSQFLINRKKEDINLFNLSGLSLQQAVDLAYLLLKIERDFQAYTKKIPNVGGVVKLATIDENGIRFVLGKTIIKPTRHL